MPSVHIYGVTAGHVGGNVDVVVVDTYTVVGVVVDTYTVVGVVANDVATHVIVPPTY